MITAVSEGQNDIQIQIFFNDFKLIKDIKFSTWD